DDWTETFHRLLSAIPSIVEAHRLTSHHDYILQIVLPRFSPSSFLSPPLFLLLSLFSFSSSLSLSSFPPFLSLPFFSFSF
ncbi:Lrp/AsnC ligand binding domain-containing protein, partial [Rhizobium ruizarguesonis]